MLCLVAYMLDANLRHIDTIRRWRGEFGTSPPFDIDDDTLVVGYSLWAEMTCFLMLGWRFPEHVFDLHTAYLAISNILLPYNPDEIPQEAAQGLVRRLPRLRHRGLGERSTSRRWPRRSAKAAGANTASARCSNIARRTSRNSAELLRRQLAGYGNYAPIDPELVMRWSEYSAKTVARIQARGMPIDMPLWNLVQENKAGGRSAR